MTKRIAINGFGRIGRAVARIAIGHPELDLVAINDPSPTEHMAHLFQFDTNYGTYDGEVSVEDEGKTLNINGKRITCFSTRQISELPWRDHEIETVIDCTGVFRTKEGVQQHVDQGAKKVVISAPAKSDGFATVVVGVNDDILTGKEQFISNASCTTNCLAPVAKALHENFEIQSGLMTTIHAYTTSQCLLDVGAKDMRRARAAAVNMIPTSTGAAKAVGLVLPELNGKLNGMSVRVPMSSVSLVDLVVKVKAPTSAEAVNAALKKASEANPHVLGFEKRPLVSSDYRCDSRSSIVDASETMVIDDMVKVLAWYDNEWGYSSRIVDLMAKL